MNHFQNLGKPFANNRFPGHIQQQTHANPNVLLRNESTHSLQHLNLAGFQLPCSQDLNTSQKRLASYTDYDLIAKRVKRFQENITEPNSEPLTIPNQLRVGMRPEDLQSRLGGQQTNDNFAAFNQNLQKAQNGLSGFGQEGNPFSNNPNSMDPAFQLLLQQYLNKGKQEQAVREGVNSQTPLTLPSDSFYPLIANNLALSNLFSNNISPNNQLPVEFLRLLEAQQNAFQQIQFLINNQYIQNLQPPGLNSNLKGNNALLQNAANPWAASFAGGGFPNRAPLSSVSPTNLNIKGNSIHKSKLTLSPQTGFKKCNTDPMFENAAKNIKIEVPNHEKMEEIMPVPEKKSDDFTCEEALTQASSMKEERGEFTMLMGKDFYNPRYIKKSKTFQSKEVFMPSIPKKAVDRRKNKWQTMKNEGVPVSDATINLEEQGQIVPKPIYVEKIPKKPTGGWRKPRVENSEQEIDGQNFEAFGMGVVYQKNKEKAGRGISRKRGNLKKNKNSAMMIEERNNMWLQANMQNSTGNHYGLSIMSSYGKNPVDLVMQEEDQMTRETRLGKEYQVEIPELDLEHNYSERKIVKMVWSPEIFSEESLWGYFAKLQGLLGCRGINEEKAIKMLGKKNMIQEDVIVTVKKNEKFYSNFLGTSSFIRESKHKKISE